MIKKQLLLPVLLILTLTSFNVPAYADGDIGLIFRGVARTLFSVFEIPRAILEQSTQVMFPFGIVTGTVSGSVRTVVGTLLGAADIARGAAPYAKYMVFFI